MQLIRYLIEKYCPFNIRTFQIIAGLLTALLLGAVLVLGWMSSKKVTEVVTKDFNEQQLVLAHHAARQIENNLNILRKELTLLGLSPSIQYFEKVSLASRMGITYSSVKEEGVREIRYAESTGGRAYILNANGYKIRAASPEDIAYLRWAGHKKNKGIILTSEVRPASYGDNGATLIAKMAVPVWQVSLDETNPVAKNEFSGVLTFVIDATPLIERLVKDIRSGKTGYAWVMDEEGIFLYHPEAEFIGKNAFEARKEKKPTISFARINEIQKSMMLQGKEGTSWYISGWHRGKEGQMKKLIAYSPIHLSDDKTSLWSVAVVAPISEVEDAIHLIHVRQFLLQAVIVLVILLGGLTVISLMVNWSRALESEVEKKTNEFKKSEQRYKSLVENAEDIIFTADYGGNILSINSYGAKFMNKDRHEIVGANIARIIPPPHSEPLLATIKEVFDTKKGRQITHQIRVADNEHWLNTNLRRLMDEAGEIYAVLGISRDVTDRQRRDENVFRTEKLASLGTLAAGVAHEINNPLGIILGFTDLLLEKSPPGTEEHDALKTIERQSLRAKGVVENLLSFARHTEHKEELVDINKNIETVLSVIGNTLLMNKITLERNLSDALPPIKGYKEELQQVFFNIITNAISAMKGGGVIKITSAARDGLVRIRIDDTGHGIKKEHRRKIFDPLFTTKKIGEGTGLGLSVSYGIVMKHKGSIEFETKTKEESTETGTSFIITLPAFTEEQT